MNIISVEGIIQGISKIKEKYNNPSEYYKYDTFIFKQDSILKDLIELDPDNRETYERALSTSSE